MCYVRQQSVLVLAEGEEALSREDKMERERTEAEVARIRREAAAAAERNFRLVPDSEGVVFRHTSATETAEILAGGPRGTEHFEVSPYERNFPHN